MKTLALSTALVFIAFSTIISAQGVPAPYTPRLQTVYTGLSRPILLTNAKDGSKRIFIVQQTGLIRVFQPGATTPTTFIDLSSKILVPSSTSDERGLLGLAFHPQFETNGKFYVYYNRAGDYNVVIAEYRLSSTNPDQGDITTERILITYPKPNGQTNHNGGMLEFSPADGYLYIGTGDGGGGNDTQNFAQNRSRILGKILRIDVNVPPGSQDAYAIPATNPFVGAGTERCPTGAAATQGNTCREIWAIGMRNPWRWSFDRGGTNQQYVGDVGQGAVEEIDIITGGANYGWRVYEGTSCTNNDPGLCTPGPFTFPITEYSSAGTGNPRCSVTGGYVYRGRQGALPGGTYIFGDYCSGEIFMNTAATLLQDTPRLIPSFGEDEDGELYVVYTNGQIDKITRARASADFDGDLRTDVSVYRPSTGTWYALNSSNNTAKIVQWGNQSDIPTPEDFDGDFITDVAVFRPTDGNWYYIRSSDGAFVSASWGANGDIPAAGDYDGDTKADLAVYRPTSGTWWILRSSDLGFDSYSFGTAGDKPVTGDFDGDGKYDISLWRASDGTWQRLNSTNGQHSIVSWGANGDIPAAGDFDGDGRTDHAVFRPSTGTWYILRSSNLSSVIAQWGVAGDVPAVGDYDADGRDDIAVFRPSTGTWYVLRSSDNQSRIINWGANGDTPLPTSDNP